MTTPDTTDPRRSGGQPGGPTPEVARSATNGQVPEPLQISEDEPVEDRPLVDRVPDRPLQRRATLVVGVVFVVLATTVCVVAITTRSAPETLLVAVVLVAAATFAMVRHIFPK